MAYSLRDIIKQRTGEVAATPVTQKSYVIVCDSRKDNTTLLLVDRRKSRKQWWTHNLSIALVGTKKEMDKVIKKLRYNNPRVMSIDQYFNI